MDWPKVTKASRRQDESTMAEQSDVAVIMGSEVHTKSVEGIAQPSYRHDLRGVRRLEAGA